jgi:hypothetical protein
MTGGLSRFTVPRTLAPDFTYREIVRISCIHQNQRTWYVYVILYPMIWVVYDLYNVLVWCTRVIHLARIMYWTLESECVPIRLSAQFSSNHMANDEKCYWSYVRWKVILVVRPIKSDILVVRPMKSDIGCASDEKWYWLCVRWKVMLAVFPIKMYIQCVSDQKVILAVFSMKSDIDSIVL